MAFEGVSEKLQAVFKRLNSRGKLNEADVKEAMREIKLALLEADVNFMVVKDFVKTVTDRAVGSEVLESLTPGQQVIKIVNDELVKLMGGSNAKLEFGSKNPSVILLAGLQGFGDLASDQVGACERGGGEPLQDAVAPLESGVDRQGGERGGPKGQGDHGRGEHLAPHAEPVTGEHARHQEADGNHQGQQELLAIAQQQRRLQASVLKDALAPRRDTGAGGQVETHGASVV